MTAKIKKKQYFSLKNNYSKKKKYGIPEILADFR